MRTVWAVLVLVCAVACGSSEDPESIELGDDAARRKLADVNQPVPEEPTIEQPAPDAGAVPAPVQDASVPAPQQDAAAAPVADASVPAPDASAPVTPDAAAPVADASTPAADASVTPDAAVVEPEPAGLTFYDGRAFEYVFSSTLAYHERRLTLHVDEDLKLATIERFDLRKKIALSSVTAAQTAPNVWNYSAGNEKCTITFTEKTDAVFGVCTILVKSVPAEGVEEYVPVNGSFLGAHFVTKRAL